MFWMSGFMSLSDDMLNRLAFVGTMSSEVRFCGGTGTGAGALEAFAAARFNKVAMSSQFRSKLDCLCIGGLGWN